MAGGKSGGISGIAVALASFGGVAVYVGFRAKPGVTIIAALREALSGRPVPVSSAGVNLAGDSSSSTGSIRSYGPGNPANATATGAGVVAAAQPYMADKYSQTKRTQPGWSDCSSFVDKVLLRMSIDPPVKWASSSNYRNSKDWQTIATADGAAGDVAVSSHHIVILAGTGGTKATCIGQQNPRINVQTASLADLMSGQTYVVKRYVGGSNGKSSTGNPLITFHGL